MALSVNRSYTPRTTRLLAEFLAQHYPDAKIIQEFHLTQLNPAARAQIGAGVKPRAGGTILGYPDAAVITPGEIMLWEAKDVLNGAAIGQIESYGELYRMSYEATTYGGLPVSLHLLVAIDNPNLHSQAASKGISIAVYNPPWYAASQMSVQSAAAQRQTDAEANAIVSAVVSGQKTVVDGETELQALGLTVDSAKQKIDFALGQKLAPQPSGGST